MLTIILPFRPFRLCTKTEKLFFIIIPESESGQRNSKCIDQKDTFRGHILTINGANAIANIGKYNGDGQLRSRSAKTIAMHSGWWLMVVCWLYLLVGWTVGSPWIESRMVLTSM